MSATEPKTARERFVEALRPVATELKEPNWACHGYAGCGLTHEQIVAACDAFADAESRGHSLMACPEQFAIVNPLYGDAEADHRNKHRASLRAEVFGE